MSTSYVYQEYVKRKTILISGYLTTELKNKVAPNLPHLWSWIFENKPSTTFANKLPSQIGQLGQVVTLEKLGIGHWDWRNQFIRLVDSRRQFPNLPLIKKHIWHIELRLVIAQVSDNPPGEVLTNGGQIQVWMQVAVRRFSGRGWSSRSGVF
ncbi:hypothetical protein [Mycoplasma sp. ATU-Cv-508]|uniref:hypothetical protein n=1 Tax=Mycoplasma sp. ATU-Cv-508 TaxID=2048001 RepID=UPI000FDF2805